MVAPPAGITKSSATRKPDDTAIPNPKVPLPGPMALASAPPAPCPGWVIIGPLLNNGPAGGHEGEGLGVGLAEGEGDGLGLGVGDGLGLGLGDGLGLGLGDGLGLGVGVPPPVAQAYESVSIPMKFELLPVGPPSSTK